jgi:hypothetical protein
MDATCPLRRAEVRGGGRCRSFLTDEVRGGDLRRELSSAEVGGNAACRPLRPSKVVGIDGSRAFRRADLSAKDYCRRDRAGDSHSAHNIGALTHGSPPFGIAAFLVFFAGLKNDSTLRRSLV